MRLAFFLGTHPELSKKEIEAAATILSLPWNTSMLSPGVLELKTLQALPWEEQGIGGYLSAEAQDLRTAVNILQRRLGGTIQIALLWQQSSLRDCATVLANALGTIPVEEGARWTLGVRVAGKSSIEPERLALQVKRELKTRGRAMRYVPSRDGTAGTFHYKLDLARFDPVKPALEAVIFPESSGVWLGVTLSVQDVDEYSRRDYGLPVSDAASGMLPPKLAQIMINLCLGGGSEHAVVYDPFCGNGRVLLEAWNMGFSCFGSDIETDKVSASYANLYWEMQRDELVAPQPELRVWQADATSVKTAGQLSSHIASRQALYDDEQIYIISEPYLGKPLRAPLQPQEARGWLKELGALYERFFFAWSSENIAAFVVVFPIAKLAGGGHASLLDYLFDRLVAMGYAPKRLSTYARPDAIVGRDIVRILRN